MLDAYIVTGVLGVLAAATVHAATQPDPRVDLAPAISRSLRLRERIGWLLWGLWASLTGGYYRW